MAKLAMLIQYLSLNIDFVSKRVKRYRFSCPSSMAGKRKFMQPVVHGMESLVPSGHSGKPCEAK